MRSVLVAGLLWAVSSAGSACDCFTPEMRLKTAQEALQSAHVAVFARVVEVDGVGNARLLVLESFKGPASGSTIDVAADAPRCAAQAFTTGEQALLLSFRPTSTACDKHPPGHYLLTTFRSMAAKAP